MKDEFILDIDRKFNELLVNNPIREKKDLLKIFFETIRYYLIYDIKNRTLDNIKKHNTVLDSKNYGKVIIKISKMSRIIYKLDNKIFSISFPFNISKTEEGYNIYDSISEIKIDSLIISKIINILNHFSSEIDDIYEFLTQFDDGNNDEESLNKIWQIFKKALFSECGYLRYDYDEEHENGRTHPLNHYDIYYTNTNTFKVGLNDKIDLDKFIDLLDLTTDCHYFK
ncbi:hypothetical protein [Fusobacterium polymorphum]|uniref:hypothetical protein n=1 Tax=Fusobacterium nucleatum subsp. polymorphum TaxID=76857 RepID=UPI00300BA6ED